MQKLKLFTFFTLICLTLLGCSSPFKSATDAVTPAPDPQLALNPKPIDDLTQEETDMLNHFLKDRFDYNKETYTPEKDKEHLEEWNNQENPYFIPELFDENSTGSETENITSSTLTEITLLDSIRELTGTKVLVKISRETDHELGRYNTSIGFVKFAKLSDEAYRTNTILTADKGLNSTTELDKNEDLKLTEEDVTALMNILVARPEFKDREITYLAHIPYGEPESDKAPSYDIWLLYSVNNTETYSHVILKNYNKTEKTWTSFVAYTY